MYYPFSMACALSPHTVTHLQDERQHRRRPAHHRPATTATPRCLARCPRRATCPPATCCFDCVAQVVPIAAAFILTVSAGAIFGGVKGTAMVLTCSTVSASISFAFSRSFGRELVLEAAQESPQ